MKEFKHKKGLKSSTLSFLWLKGPTINSTKKSRALSFMSKFKSRTDSISHTKELKESLGTFQMLIKLWKKQFRTLRRLKAMQLPRQSQSFICQRSNPGTSWSRKGRKTETETRWHLSSRTRRTRASFQGVQTGQISNLRWRSTQSSQMNKKRTSWKSTTFSQRRETSRLKKRQHTVQHKSNQSTQNCNHISQSWNSVNSNKKCENSVRSKSCNARNKS